jgi:hypothetical protein
MNRPSLLEILKEHALSRGYTLVAEDFDGGPDFFPPDMFIVKDALGVTYRVSVDDLASDG